MSLKRNVVANYIGQIYLAMIGIVMLPVHVRYLGTEAYGLVGFYAMLQAWFLLLDLGLTSTLARELSRFRTGALARVQAAKTVRSLEWFFGVMGGGCALTLAIASGWIAANWLKAQHLAEDEMRMSVHYMGVIIGLRGWTGLYRGGLAGLERLVPLNVAGMVLATLRSVGVLAVLIFWSARPSVYFAYQLAVAVLELSVMGGMFYRAFPMRGAGPAPAWRSLSGIVRLSGGMAFLTCIWAVFSQTDKLVLSWVLSLKDYGLFTVAATLAGAISLLAAPLSQALQPRFNLLAVQNREYELVTLYRTSTQLTCAIGFAVAGVLVGRAEPLLRAWTGNAELAREAARILPLYVLGNAVVAILSLAFMLQFALGKIRWQVIGNCLFGVIWIPGAYLAATRGGAVGTGWVWLIGNLLFLLCWLPYVHHRLLPKLGLRWLVNDVGAILLTVLVGAFVISRFGLTNSGRFGVFAEAAVMTGVLLLVGLCTGSETRKLLLDLCRRYVFLKSS